MRKLALRAQALSWDMGKLAREVADRTWDLVHDRPDSDPVKQRVVQCHESLARLTHLGD